MAAHNHRLLVANALLALAGTIDGIKEEDYTEDATELFSADDARNLREAASIVETAVVTPDLRDYFAGKVLSGMMADGGSHRVVMDSLSPGQRPTEKIAEICYSIADAMLAERSKGGVH